LHGLTIEHNYNFLINFVSTFRSKFQWRGYHARVVAGIFG
jgi:hypothetical protein